MLTKGNRK